MKDAVGPVFVAGCPRSGTTALSWAIAEHPGYFTSAETHFYYYLLRQRADSLREVFDKSAGEGSWLKKYDIGFDRFLYHIGVGFDRMMREGSGGLQWIDGSPENVMVGEALFAMFPAARMFIVVRDPRYVCLSMLNSGFAPLWARDLEAAIREWRHYARIGAELAAAHPDRVEVIKQEDMRRRPDLVAAVIAKRLELSEASAIAAFLATRTVNSSFDKQTYADDSPYRGETHAAIAAQEFFANHGEHIIGATADLAEYFGYSTALRQPPHASADSGLSA